MSDLCSLMKLKLLSSFIELLFFRTKTKKSKFLLFFKKKIINNDSHILYNIMWAFYMTKLEAPESARKKKYFFTIVVPNAVTMYNYPRRTVSE